MIYSIFPAFSKYEKWKVINPTYEGTGKGLLSPQDKTLASLEKTSWFLSFRQYFGGFPDLLTENPSSRLTLLGSRWTSIAFRLNRSLLLDSLARNLVFCSTRSWQSMLCSATADLCGSQSQTTEALVQRTQCRLHHTGANRNPNLTATRILVTEL